jgi:hypothetical protein
LRVSAAIATTVVVARIVAVATASSIPAAAVATAARAARVVATTAAAIATVTTARRAIMRKLAMGLPTAVALLLVLVCNKKKMNKQAIQPSFELHFCALDLVFV